VAFTVIKNGYRDLKWNSSFDNNNRSMPKRFGLLLVFIWSLKLQDVTKKKIKKSNDKTLKVP